MDACSHNYNPHACTRAHAHTHIHYTHLVLETRTHSMMATFSCQVLTDIRTITITQGTRPSARMVIVTQTHTHSGNHRHTATAPTSPSCYTQSVHSHTQSYNHVQLDVYTTFLTAIMPPSYPVTQRITPTDFQGGGGAGNGGRSRGRASN